MLKIFLLSLIYICLWLGVPEEAVPADSRAEKTDWETQKHGA